jgi:hypothetical protein
MMILKAAILLGSIVLLAGLSRAEAGDCPGAEGQDCNSNGRSDRYDLNPRYEFPDAQVFPLSPFVNPTAAIAKDLDADGAPDLALIDIGFGTLSIFSNRSGTFEKTEDLPLDGHPKSLAVADFDRDGDFDLAVGGARPGADISHCIWILWNRGDGLFPESRMVPVGWYPNDIVAEDLDGDGFPDLVFTSGRSSMADPPLPTDGAWLAWNKGDGSFEDPEKLVSGCMEGIAAADFDGDGRLDLAMVGTSQSFSFVWVSRNKGGRGFEDSPARYAVSSSPICIAAIDVDRDGELDLVTGHYEPRVLSTLLNVGSGTFGEARKRWMAGSPAFLVPADLEGDGFPELVIQLLLHRESTEWVILETGGGDDFTGEIRIWAEGGDEVGRSVAAADFNGDGRVDLAAMGVNHFLVFYNLPGNPRSKDCNGNCIPDECETDCNRNGLLDSCDIAQGISEDCDGNGVPDECEPDCNRNGLLDSCDIARRISEDCDGNGVPDECELAQGDCDRNGILDACEEDCDGNSRLDLCEILEGTAADCNGNGTMDACEIARGESPDCNANGIPDGCELMMAPGFEGPRGFWVGPTLYSAPAGDLDGDGDLDLAALETGYPNEPGRISLLLNEGKGTFSHRPIDPGFPLKPVVGTVGDFDGDGSLDLAVATEGPPRTMVFINRKDGRFEPAGSAEIPARPSAIVASDLDGDGDLDLSAATFGSAEGGSVTVLRNLGGGNLEAAPAIPVAGIPASIAAADLDLDGRPDLAIPRSPGGGSQPRGIVVLWGRGKGEFESPVVLPGSEFSSGSSRPSSIAASDLNGDGFPDLTLATEGPLLRVFFHQEGRFSWKTVDLPSTTSTTAVVATDLDGDGDLDLAAGTYNGVQPFRNDGPGTFAPGALAEAGGSCWEIRAGDLDGDGDNDLAATGYELGMVLVFPNQGAGTFSIAEETIPPDLDSAHFPVAADLDGDGMIDLAAGAPWDGPRDQTAVSVLWNEGGGRFGEGEKFDVPKVMNRLVPGDFDGDGLPDLVVVHANPVAVSILTHVAPRRFTLGPPIPVADEGAMAEDWIPAAAGDLNGDGALDLAVAVPGTAYFLLNRGGGFEVSPQLTSMDGDPTSLAAGDLDGDGRADLVLSGGIPTTLYFSRGDAWFVNLSESPFLRSVAIADVDGDGNLDFAGATGEGVLLYNSGGGGIMPAGLGPERMAFRFLEADSIISGDLDGDMDQDFALAHSRSLVLLVNNGRGGFRLEAIATPEPPLGLNAVDLDGDGDRDLAFRSSRDDRPVISVLWNSPRASRDDLDGNKVPDECGHIPPPSRFVRGDTNADGALDLSDSIAILGYLFLGEALLCLDAADPNDDGTADISDAIGLLTHLFLGGEAPRAPSGACGLDPTPDGLDCKVYTRC